ncbi:hypothetical protein PBI_TOURACH_132 [Mycobacterium phage Tourach]|uniref:DUF3846 domain-containing protein n=1 Tax=Mycobacterium phage Tourach TaxID=2599882 RepID=A0A5J6TU68_9CAUD|nr:hypothetical protein J4T98_gp118 [Mycobacterium phage Tourach]QFG14355.1 hypothetical protein PBI_TOURACH_132 [Mycobacterium phage Tourach]
MSDMSNDTHRALVLHPSGARWIMEVTNTHELTAMRHAVDGDIEAAYGWTGPDVEAADVTFFINGEGRILNQPVNWQATTLWWSVNPVMTGKDHLRGVVVVTGGADEDGNTLAVPGKVVEMVERAGE